MIEHIYGEWRIVDWPMRQQRWTVWKRGTVYWFASTLEEATQRIVREMKREAA